MSNNVYIYNVKLPPIAKHSSNNHTQLPMKYNIPPLDKTTSTAPKVKSAVNAPVETKPKPNNKPVFSCFSCGIRPQNVLAPTTAKPSINDMANNPSLADDLNRKETDTVKRGKTYRKRMSHVQMTISIITDTKKLSQEVPPLVQIAFGHPISRTSVDTNESAATPASPFQVSCLI
jgi:hypothetical protein